MKGATKGRRYARTRHLHLIGLVSQFAEIGDTVCVLAGCQVLLVIRRGVHERWRLVGEAYIHGLMDGAASELVDKGQRVVETIVLE